MGADVSGTGIPAGATVSRILDATTYELSAPAVQDSGSSTTLTYSGFNTLRLTGNNTIGFVRLIGSAIALQGTNTLTDNIMLQGGQLRLGGTNTFSGVLAINAGSVRLESPTAIASPSGWELRVNAGSLDLNGYSTQVSRLTGGGGVTNGGVGSSVLTVNAINSHQFDGVLSDGLNGGTLSLVKNGTGTLSLTSSTSDYTGPTVINGGSLMVRNLSFGGQAGALGAASNAAANLVMNGGSLHFSDNSATFTDRSFTLGVGDNAGGIYADGTLLGSTMTVGFNGISPAIAFQGTGSRVLTLGGFNRGDNKFNLVLGDGPEGPTSLTKTGNGTWVIGATNSYKGETLVLAGILAATVDGAFGGAGAAGVIIAGGTNGSASLGNTNPTVDLRNVNYATPQNLYLAGGTLATTVGNSSWSGPVFATANSLLSIGDGASLTLSGALGGGNAITQLGGGMLVLSGQADVTTRNAIATSGPHHTVQAGTLRLDYTTNNNSKLADSGTLVLGGSRLGGRLELVAGSHVEVVGSTTIGSGANSIARLSGTSIVRLNGISRQIGGTVNFTLANIASTDTDNVSGILGAWATVGLSDWAAKTSLNEAGTDTGASTGADKLIGLKFIRRHSRIDK